MLVGINSYTHNHTYKMQKLNAPLSAAQIKNAKPISGTNIGNQLVKRVIHAVMG